MVSRTTVNRRACLPLLAVHALLVVDSLIKHNVTVDEGGHVISGVLAWEEGRVDVYPVNPPLIKGLVALPVVVSRPELSEMVRWTVSPGWDSQHDRFARDNSERYLEMIFRARYVLVGLSVLGGWLIYRWSSELFGQTCGLVGLALWAFCPNILCWSGVCTVDLGASVMGLAAAYAFHYYLHHPSWLAAAQAGWVLGLAMLSKFTLLVLYPVLGLVWVVGAISNSRQLGQNRGEDREPTPAVLRPGAKGFVGWGQLLVVVLVSVLVIDMGYGFRGVGRQLGSFDFRCHALSRLVESPWVRATWLDRLSILLPEQYVKGLDQQIHNAELRIPGYLNGEWKKGGWWYFYLYVLAIKLPLGTLALMALVLVLMLVSRRYRAGFLRECQIWLPALAVIVLLSWQMRDRYASIRYILPAFMFIGISRVGMVIQDAWRHLVVSRPLTPIPSSPQGRGEKRRWRATIVGGAVLVVAALLWNGISVLRIHPHYLSYFNELAGGPENGWKHLIESNIDWGQDLLLLKKWVEQHPEAQPLGFAFYGGMDPHLVGLEYQVPAFGPEEAEADTGMGLPPHPGPLPRRGEGRKVGPQADEGRTVGPMPGWYAISVNFVCGTSFGSYDEMGRPISFPPGAFSYFRHFEPVAKAGYSIFIYHITTEEANRVRPQLGLSPLLELGG